MKQTQQGSSDEPLSNLAYDVMTIIQSKAKGLHAYQQYLDDAQAAQRDECVELIRKIADDDRRHVAESTQHLLKLLSREVGEGQGQGQPQGQGRGQGQPRGGQMSGAQTSG